MQPLICTSTAMQEVARLVERAARADCPVFIWGEDGSGKKAVAETIHNQSLRGHRPLVVLHARERPRQALDGFLAAGAQGGSLLIDDVNALPLTDQARLLKITEAYRPANRDASADQPGDFRLIATSRHELSECVKRGTLREDLCYRLAVVTIHVPPLRQRKEDIPWLVRHFLKQSCEACGRAAPQLHPELMRRLTEYAWRGNARQLRDCLDRMVSATDAETLGVEHLPSSLSNNGWDCDGVSSRQHVDKLADLERAAMMRALEVHDGNRTQAARALGISVRTLQRKLRHWGV